MKDYHINIYYSDTLQGYVADIPDLEGCRVLADSPQDALSNILIAKQKWLDDAAKNGDLIPEPIFISLDYSVNTLKTILINRISSGMALLHDVRRYLPMIVGYSGLIRLGVLGEISDKTRDAATHIYQSGIQLESMLHAIYDIERLRAGDLTVNMSPISFKDHIETKLQYFNRQILEKEQLLAIHILTDLPQIAADEGHIIKIMKHLLDAVSHFSPEGSEIVLNANVDPAENTLHVQIISNRGVVPDHFVESALNDPYWGSFGYPEGLIAGLFIAAKLIELNGGKMWVDTDEDAGCTFHFTLPLADE